MLTRFDYLAYTLRHRKAFREVEKDIYGQVSLRGWLHDLDKVALYPILGVRLTSKIHRATARHHHRRAHTVEDYREMVIDWECARFTKPDKPLNAYDTLFKYYPDLIPQILPILREYHLDHETGDTYK